MKIKALRRPNRAGRTITTDPCVALAPSTAERPSCHRCRPAGRPLARRQRRSPRPRVVTRADFSMTGLSARIAAVLKAKLTGRPGRHDGPTELLSRRYEQQLQQLETVKQDIADVISVQKQLRLSHSTPEQDVRSLEQRIGELQDAEQRLCHAEQKLLAREHAPDEQRRPPQTDRSGPDWLEGVHTSFTATANV